ncbi:MAG: site-specific DNA-methyltransferase [Bacteroidetes bacterium]|nr:site-specific DNA-methyltransferase [Bacteroidota bacterium]
MYVLAVMQNILEIENSVRNQTQAGDKSFNSWYQFVLGYPPHLVRYYIFKFGIQPEHLVLDPFCGTGTTNVECKKKNIDSLGLEANPVAFFASRVKTNWQVPVFDIRQSFQEVISSSSASLEKFGLPENVSLFVQPQKGKALQIESKLSDDQRLVLPKDFISPTPLRRVLILKDCIDRVESEPVRELFLLALANLVVNHAGNVAFGPEVYTTKPKEDVSVLDFFYRLVDRMICDLGTQPSPSGYTDIVHGDARRVSEFFPTKLGDVNFIVTSPPYPNEKDYTRTTRLESVILGFVSGKKGLRTLKEQLLRSNSRNIFVTDSDQDYIKSFDSINKIAREIEDKRIHLKKTSGFEKLYHKIVKHYFGGMYRHLESMKPLLAPDARLAYVVGDQMSFFRTHIPTAKILAEIAESLSYKVDEIELWRTRLATATKIQIEENVLILRN